MWRRNLGSVFDTGAPIGGGGFLLAPFAAVVVVVVVSTVFAQPIAGRPIVARVARGGGRARRLPPSSGGAANYAAPFRRGAPPPPSTAKTKAQNKRRSGWGFFCVFFCYKTFLRTAVFGEASLFGVGGCVRWHIPCCCCRCCCCCCCCCCCGLCWLDFCFRFFKPWRFDQGRVTVAYTHTHTHTHTDRHIDGVECAAPLEFRRREKSSETLGRRPFTFCADTSTFLTPVGRRRRSLDADGGRLSFVSCFSVSVFFRPFAETHRHRSNATASRRRPHCRCAAATTPTTTSSVHVDDADRLRFARRAPSCLIGDAAPNFWRGAVGSMATPHRPTPSSSSSFCLLAESTPNKEPDRWCCCWCSAGPSIAAGHATPSDLVGRRRRFSFRPEKRFQTHTHTHTHTFSLVLAGRFSDPTWRRRRPLRNALAERRHFRAQRRRRRRRRRRPTRRAPCLFVFFSPFIGAPVPRCRIRPTLEWPRWRRLRQAYAADAH